MQSIDKRIFSVVVLLFCLNVILNIANLNNYNYISVYVREGVSVPNEDVFAIYEILSKLPPIVIQNYSLDGNVVYITDSSYHPDYEASGHDAYYHHLKNQQNYIEFVNRKNITVNAYLIYHEFGHYLDHKLFFCSLDSGFRKIYSKNVPERYFERYIVKSPDMEYIIYGSDPIEYFADQFGNIYTNNIDSITSEYIDKRAEKYIIFYIRYLTIRSYIIPNYF